MIFRSPDCGFYLVVPGYIDRIDCLHTFLSRLVSLRLQAYPLTPLIQPCIDLRGIVKQVSQVVVPF